MKERCVLICDDDPDILEVSKIILELRGHKVETLKNCDNILSKVETIKPDIILMDLWIPDIGGEEATKLLKNNATTRHIPIIIFSANNDIEKIAKVSGADNFLCKPFEIKDLESIIESTLRKAYAE